MRDRVTELESSVALLSSEVVALRARVSALEELASDAMGEDPMAAIPEVHAEEVQGWSAVLGRTLLILGGAYLLRAATASQLVSHNVGVGAGLLYGAPWLLLAARAGVRERRLDAFGYAASTALIGFPLVWEATVRFAVLTPVLSAVLLGGLTGAAFLVATTWRLQSVAAIVTCGALASAVGLGFETGEWLPYTTLAIGVGLATLWLGYLRDWVLLRWPAALVANLMIVVLTGHPDGRFWSVLLVQLLAIGGYLGSFALRTLRRGRLVIAFELVQTVGILGLVLTSAFAFVSARPAGAFIAAAIVLSAGVVTYVVSFTMVERRAPLANLFFYTLLGLVLTIAGSTIAIPRAAPALMALAGVAAALAARRHEPAVFRTQALLWIAAAAVVSGLLSSVVEVLMLPTTGWTGIAGPAWVALLAGIAVLALPPERDVEAPWAIVGSQLALAVLVVVTVSGGAVYLVGEALRRPDGWDFAWLAALRTVVVVAVTVGIAHVSRRPAWHEAGWLTYPLLVALGVKLLASDLPAGRPLTLFVSLAAYGIALITAPRALRSPRAESKARTYATV